ncbi:alpha/beta-hydrolase [Auricularia subglabra TFB-10046 SS5]|nr:alpha/beta-hydrolase [Auricularia subglabra TFB-10046 SS5]
MFSYKQITPSANISWTPCFTGQQCALLNLPIDYNTPGSPPVSIALLMQPATDKTNYQGTILVNPGGPGGSGTDFVLSSAASLSQLFGPTFDVLGFDPRGTGASTPLAQCFSSAEEAHTWALMDVKVLRTSGGSVQLAQAQDDVIGELCARALGEWGIGRFMDTATIATDMLHIVEKLGQDKLQYYGISYGTALGQYFAALYPDRIGRMVLDGVTDGMKWQRGDTAQTVRDADRVMDAFFKDCALAGATKCAIWEPTAHAAAKRVDRILDGLKTSPIALPDSVWGPTVLTLDDVLLGIFTSLYSPLDGFPFLSQAFRAIETRAASALSQMSLFGPSPVLQSDQAIAAVGCTDFPRLNRSIAADIATVREGTTASRWGGGFAFSRARLTCGGWHIRAKRRYTGRVSSSKINVGTLAISNTIDPVTPLKGAQAVVPRFKGMRLLQQNTVGHSAIASLSSCVAQAIRAYFAAGVLPPEGTVCQPDVVPLVGPGTPPHS